MLIQWKNISFKRVRQKWMWWYKFSCRCTSKSLVEFAIVLCSLSIYECVHTYIYEHIHLYSQARTNDYDKLYWGIGTTLGEKLRPFHSIFRALSNNVFLYRIDTEKKISNQLCPAIHRVWEEIIINISHIKPWTLDSRCFFNSFKLFIYFPSRNLFHTFTLKRSCFSMD